MGDAADEADAALATGWFQLYNLFTAALAVGGAVLAAVLLRRGLSERATRRIGLLAWMAAVVLLVRGVLGTVLVTSRRLAAARANRVRRSCCS